MCKQGSKVGRLAGVLVAVSGCAGTPPSGSSTVPSMPPSFGQPLQGAPTPASPTLPDPEGEPATPGQGTPPAEGEAEIALSDAVAGAAMELAVARLRAELTGQGLETFEDLMAAPLRVCCHSLTLHGVAALADAEHPAGVRVVVVWSAEPRGQGPPQQGTTAMLVTPDGGGWRVLPAWEAGV